MDLVLFASLAISIFAFGGSQVLLMRFHAWRYGFLAALTAFLSAFIVIYQGSHLFSGSLGWSISVFGNRGEFPGLVVSVMALVAVFFLERLLAVRRQAAEAIRSAMERAALAERAKVEFLANMSHELRTPLNAIIGFSEAMRREVLGPVGHGQYKEYTRHIHESGMKLSYLIDDIMELSRMQAGAFKIVDQDVDVPTLVAALVGEMNGEAKSAGITLSADSASGPATIRADGRAIKQILFHLISNALKFTPDGGRVTVRTGLSPDGDFQLRVSDTGIGIAQDDMDKSLADFGQVDGALNRKYEGAGLGLPLCRRLVELHGGNLRIESEAGAGTTVLVELPASRVIARSPKRADAASDRQAIALDRSGTGPYVPSLPGAAHG